MKRRLAVILLVFASCGDARRPGGAPVDGAPPVDAPVSAEAAGEIPRPLPADGAVDARGPDEFIAELCALLAPCCGAAGLPADGARCRAVLDRRRVDPYQPALAGSCLEAVRATSGSDRCLQGYAVAARLCDRVFVAVTASKRLGEPCHRTEECVLSAQGPVICAAAMGPIAGRCQVRARGKEGDLPCVGTVGGPLVVAGGDPGETAARAYLCHVADGLWCDDTSRKCVPVKPASSPCTSFGECGPAHFCDDTAARCLPRKALGAPCAVDEECPSTVCGEDNRCAPASPLDPTLTPLCF